MRDCKHGRLARSCEVCELQSSLNLAVEALDNIVKHIELMGGNISTMSATCMLAKEALAKIKGDEK